MRRTHPQFNLRLDPEVKDWLAEKAKREERSQTWLINHIAKEAMRHDQQTAAQK